MNNRPMKIITLRMPDKHAQAIMFKRGTEKSRYNMIMQAEILSVTDETPISSSK